MRVRFDAPPGSATESQGLAVRYAAAKRRVSSWRWYLLFAVVVALPLYFGVQLLLALVWVTVPGQVELREASVKAGAAGHVTLLAAAGQRVEAGQALARVEPLPTATPAPFMDTRGIAPEIAAAAAEREVAARGALDLAAEQLADRAHWRRTIDELAAQGAATAAEQRSAEARWEDANAVFVRARAELASAQVAASRLQASGAAAATSAAAMRAAATAAGGASASTWPVPSPIAGRVVRVSELSGGWVAPDSEVAVVQSEDAALVRGWVQPADAKQAREGAPAQLHFYDGTHVPARVLRVEREATRVPSERLGPLAARGQTLVIVLQPLAPLPERYQVHDLPLEVRFRRW